MSKSIEVVDLIRQLVRNAYFYMLPLSSSRKLA